VGTRSSSGSRTGRLRGSRARLLLPAAPPAGRASIAVRCGEEKGEFVNLQGEPDEGRPGRGRPGGVYIIVAAIVAIAIVVLLIILIF
jgi:hypothetical protein